MMFDRYVMVDWSASRSRSTGKDSVWICVLDAGGAMVTANPETRGRAEAILLRVLHNAVDNGERVLIGFDFPYAYPRGFAAALGLTGPPWLAVWQSLTFHIRDEPSTNKNNRFEVAACLNAQLGQEVFWGRPSDHVLADLSSLRDRVVYRSESNPTGLSEWREVEALLRARGRHPQPAWKLYGNGAVGSQSLTGIPVVARLRNDVILADVSAVWPFEISVPNLPPRRPAIVHAEIWPSLIELNAARSRVKDEVQVMTLAAEYSDRDRSGTLARPGSDRRGRAHCAVRGRAMAMGGDGRCAVRVRLAATHPRRAAPRDRRRGEPSLRPSAGIPGATAPRPTGTTRLLPHAGVPGVAARGRGRGRDQTAPAGSREWPRRSQARWCSLGPSGRPRSLASHAR